MIDGCDNTAAQITSHFTGKHTHTHTSSVSVCAKKLRDHKEKSHVTTSDFRCCPALSSVWPLCDPVRFQVFSNTHTHTVLFVCVCVCVSVSELDLRHERLWMWALELELFPNRRRPHGILGGDHTGLKVGKSQITEDVLNSCGSHLDHGHLRNPETCFICVHVCACVG